MAAAFRPMLDICARFLRRWQNWIAGALLVLAVLLGVRLWPHQSLQSWKPSSVAVYDDHGRLLRLALASDDRYRLWVPLKDMSPQLIDAVLLREDRWYYWHPGFNPFGLLRGVWVTYVRHGRPQGGSTITMQLARLLWPLNTRSPLGKTRQIVRAIELELFYSKQQILEAYLNYAPYGRNVEGAGAASLVYFSKPVGALTLPEALTLAVVPQDPIKHFRNAGDNSTSVIIISRRLTASRDRLYARWLRGHPEDANLKPLFALSMTIRPLSALPFEAPHAVEQILQTQRIAGGSADARVTTTLNLDLQHALERQIIHYIARNNASGIHNASAILIDTRDMGVKALVGSANYFDRALQGQVNGTLARRSPGSTLKPFIYALAMDQGVIHPNTLLDDDPAYFAEYRPANFDGQFIGKVSARDALVLSRNIPAITLNTKIRPDLYDFLQKSGAAFPKPKNYYGLSLAVGGAEIDMRTLARFYAMLANGGSLQDIKDGTNPHIAPNRMVLSPEAALLTVQMLGHPPPDRLDFTAGSAELPIYWKTGTSSGFHDAWTAGIFGPYVLIVWTGHFDGSPNPAFVGVERAAPLFFELARALDAQEHLHDLIGPALAHRNVSMVDICASTGAPGKCAAKQPGWFIPGKSPIATPVSAALTPPKILSPRDGISYVASHQSDEKLQIPLKAEDPKGQDTLFWFDGTKLIGVAERRSPLLWTPDPGRHTIHLVNASGQSATETITVMSAE